jgi:hypothetical protein
MYNAGGDFYPHKIDHSLRLNEGESFIRYMPTVMGERKKWTWSGWVKRGNIGTEQTIMMGGGNSNGIKTTGWYFNTNDELAFRVYFINYNYVGSTKSTQVFRDPAAWYHLTLVIDTTQASQINRIKAYCNGEEVAMDLSDMPLNYNTSLNDPLYRIYIAGWYPADVNAYYANIHYVDGQALTPDNFGETKSGVWIPKEYEGTYGTNGCKLEFGNASDLLEDTGGNTLGSKTISKADQMIDTPTNNFPIMNPLISGGLEYSKGGLRTFFSGAYSSTFPTMLSASGLKFYSEVFVEDLGGDNGTVVNGWTQDGTAGDAIGWVYNGNTFGSLAAGFVMPTYTTGDILGYSLDGVNNQVQFYKNGAAAGPVWQFDANATLSFDSNSGYLYGGSALVANFGQDSSFAGNKTAQGNTDANGIGDFYYAPPADHLALCSANLPAPAIDPAKDDIPADYFNPVLYTGDSSSPRSITGVGFQPDLVWMKARSAALVHGLYDSVRGPAKLLISNDTGAEIDTDPYGYVSSYDTDGFTLTAGTINNDTFNNSGHTYVAWNWKAGGTAVANTDGTIASQVSANTKAGFSVVTYTGNGTDGASVGHGLTKAPDLMIIKNRTTARNWIVYSSALTYTNYLSLDTANAASSGANVWNTDPSDTVFYLSTFPENNGTSEEHVCYAFHSVEGFSKIGSYTGNGSSTDGPFVYTGFRPAYVLLKSASTGNTDWTQYDSARETYNTVDQYLIPNKSNAEASPSGEALDLTSNGFKVRGSWVGMNSGTIIYMAFAEQPFKYANAR